MRKSLVVFAILAFLSCEKKTTTPDPVKPDPTPSCTTATPNLEGMYVAYVTQYKSDASFTYSKNNCPTENQNYYIVSNLAGVLGDHLKDPEAVPAGTMQILVDETTGMNISEDLSILKIQRMPSGHIEVRGSAIHNGGPVTLSPKP